MFCIPRRGFLHYHLKHDHKSAPERIIVKGQQMPDDDLRIIIVDNELSARETLRDLLESKGYHVRTVGDGVEALRCFEETAFDVAFTELHMPHMGGLELLNRLKARFPEVFVVLLTEDGSTELAAQATRKYGAFD